MYNIIIVDDEPVIRFGLKASVNWEQEGLSLIGDYSNGEEAWTAMEDNHVDILITDIKMPVMDGLTLMKKAIKRFPKLKVILVSSYNDFEYVKEGLVHGAVDYVLKHTLEPEEFIHVIRKCVSKVKEEEKIEEKLDIVNKSTHLKERKKLEQDVKRFLLLGEEHVQHISITDFLPGPFLFIYMKMNHVEKLEAQYGFLYKSLILEEIQEAFYTNRENGICILIGESDVLFLLNDVSNPVRAIQQLYQDMIDGKDMSFSFGYDMIYRLNELNKGFQRSFSACERRFFYPEKSIFDYQPKEKQLVTLNFEQLKQFLLPYDEKKINEFVEDRYKLWKQEIMEPSEIKEEACSILTNLFAKKLDHVLLLDKCAEIKGTELLDELTTLLLEQIKECNLLITEEPLRANADNELMDNAFDYIHQHYTEELTLKMVADHIHISRNYFSILFRRQCDQKFIDYVIELRIKKASELLRDTSQKVYEVAKNSGFNDVKYFSKLFKKMTGHTPGSYRSKHQN
ncbi:hypothetical protein BKP35_05565 [Anaerobacillus arseniciselenatis]|uniref:DNA-binding response regulator n=1 Tax=Anaerobacillus arseniciselenatis TaxID=85682 RepID=A0A1S2LRR3_9BACI|nr:response regulator [Anaerobacillus arseniciselenatis]OIJ14900.1 hypothetical protein BKP35_05565 [Anaerobacillus arseniciselenatis]